MTHFSIEIKFLSCNLIKFCLTFPSRFPEPVAPGFFYTGFMLKTCEYRDYQFLMSYIKPLNNTFDYYQKRGLFALML